MSDQWLDAEWILEDDEREILQINGRVVGYVDYVGKNMFAAYALSEHGYRVPTLLGYWTTHVAAANAVENAVQDALKTLFLPPDGGPLEKKNG